MSFAASLVNHFSLMLDRRNIQNRRRSGIPFDCLLQVSERGSSEAVSQDPEAKTEELLQQIRVAEVIMSLHLDIYHICSLTLLKTVLNYSS